ncbi:hypothetical protein CVIRNUC_003554 [Coccomyxa viridis]|uniref:Uncharacterized protein n=1 Tax=Coccomyxa viridis TaxID=1274662 RepID=A0AAV1I392_9CHLO|nr:hypothetical protein CVIRNUC_003554 [Coccomyxa viridis]
MSTVFFNNAYTKYGAGSDNKSLQGLPDDPTAGSSDLTVDSIDVTGDATIEGNLVANAITPQFLGAYEQDGPVNNANQSITNTNIVSGQISGVNIVNSQGRFTNLYSGSSNTGYEVKFFGSGSNTAFEFNGAQDYASLNNAQLVIGLPKPSTTSSLLQISAPVSNSLPASLITSIVGSIITGTFSGVNAQAGDYISLPDGREYQITGVGSSGTFLTVQNTGLNQTSVNETYAISTPGWVFDTSGNLVGQGYGYLTLPQVNPSGDTNANSTQVGSLRYDQVTKQFEGLLVVGTSTTPQWVPIAADGNLANTSGNTGISTEVEPGTDGLDRLRFYENGTDVMAVNAEGQVSIGTLSGGDPSAKFFVLGNATVDGTITGSSLVIQNAAAIGSSLSVGQNIFASGSGTFLGGLSVQQSATIGGSLSVADGLVAQSYASVLGTLTVGSALVVQQGATIAGQLYIGSSTYVEGDEHIHGNLIVDGTTTLNGAIHVTGPIIDDGDLTVGGVTTFDGTVLMNDTLILNSYASINGNLTVGGSILGTYASLSGAIQTGTLLAQQGSFIGTITSGAVLAANASLSGTLLSSHVTAQYGSFSTLTAQTASLSGSILAQSASLSGSLTAQSASLTGSILAQSASLSGTLLAQTASLSSTVFASTVLSSVGSFSTALYAPFANFQTATITNLAATSVTALAASLSGPLFAQSISSSFASVTQLSAATVTSTKSSVTGSLFVGGTVSAAYAALQSVGIVNALSVGGSLVVNNNAFFDGTITALAANFIYGGSNSGGGGGTVVFQGVDDGTLAGTILSVSDSGTIGSNLVVGQSLSAGALSVTSSGSFGGDLFIGGTLTGAAIGAPPSPYTQYPSPPGLLPSDTVSEALYKISQEFQYVNEEPPPDPNANGDLMLNLRDIHLVLDVPGFQTACIAASTLTVSDLISQTSPATKLLPYIYDGSTGTLTAILQSSGSQSVIGTVVVDAIPLGGSATNQSLVVSSKAFFFQDGSLQASLFVYVDALIVPTQPLTPGPTAYAYQVAHSKTGATNHVTFHIDDSTPATVTGSLTVTFGTLTRCVSGVLSYVAGDPVSIGATISGAIGSYYNCSQGLCSASGDIIQQINEASDPGRNIASYTPGSTQYVALTTTIPVGVYTEAGTVTLTPYNALGSGSPVSVTTLNGSPHRTDTVSVILTTQVTSGSGPLPQQVGVDFGLPYDHTVSLMTNSELQLIDGHFRVPLALDYAASLPNGSPDYSAIASTVSWRYATFSFTLSHCSSTLFVCFTGQVGTAWGGGSCSALDTTIQVRVVGPYSDSHWLDANSFFTGSTALCTDGAPCLLAEGTSATVKHITLGGMREGQVFVRVGFEAVNNTYGKGFSSVSIRPDILAPVRDMASEVLRIEDPLFTAFVAGSLTLVDCITTNTSPSSCVVDRFYDGASGTVYALLLTDPCGGSTSSLGSIQLSSLRPSESVTSGALTVFDQLDCFPYDPAKQGHCYSASAQITPVNAFTPSASILAYQLEHSGTGKTNPACFAVDAPQTPSATSLHLSITGSTTQFSGILTWTTLSVVSAVFTADGVISYFYNPGPGLARLSGYPLATANESDLPGRNVQLYQPFSGQTLTLTSHFLDDCYSESCVLDLEVFNSTGSSTLYPSLCPGTLTDIRIDTLSLTSPSQVTSGFDTYPSVPGTDFGLPYDHSVSIAATEELQLIGGCYRVPPSRNYTQCSPASADYSTITSGQDYRYATFKFDVRLRSSGVMVKLFGQQGLGWGNGQAPADGLYLCVRLVDSEYAVDTGWLDGNAPYDGISMPQGNGAGVLLLESSTTSQKVLTVGRCVEGTLFVRIGFSVVSSTLMSFRSLAVFDPYWDATTIDRTVLTLQGNVYSGGLCLTDSVVHDITISNQPSSTAFLRIDPGYAYLQAQQLDTAGNWSDAGCVALTQLSDDGDYITATRLKARKAYATCGAIVEATVLSALLTPGTLLSGIRLAAIPKAQLMTQQFSTPVYFHYDVPPTPAFVTPLAASITGSIKIFSGVHTYIAGASVTVTGTASGVVSYFYNSAHGIAALSGPVITPVDYTGPVSSLTPFGNQSLDITAQVVSQVYSEAPELMCVLYNFIGQSTSQTCVLGARIDTISSPILTQVTSGLGQFPANPGTDFGLTYDQTASLMSNQELMLVGGLYRTPPQKNYSLTLPAGSPDYTNASSQYAWRYATFKFPVSPCMSSFSLVLQNIQGSGWGDCQTVAVDVQIYARFVGPIVDTGWLDCNQFFDGVHTTQGSGVLLGDGTTAAIKQATAGRSISGVAYVRIGLASSDFTKGFSSVALMSH